MSPVVVGGCVGDFCFGGMEGVIGFWGPPVARWALGGKHGFRHRGVGAVYSGTAFWAMYSSMGLSSRLT